MACLFDTLDQIHRGTDFFKSLSNMLDRFIGSFLGPGMGGDDHCISGFKGA